MSKRDSTPKIDNSRSLATEAQRRFFALDHVGVVRHIEGIDLQILINSLRNLLGSWGVEFEDAVEEVRERIVYTNVAVLRKSEELTLWLTAREIEGIGCVLDSKVFHQTDQSAVADEQLSKLIDELQESILSSG